MSRTAEDFIRLQFGQLNVQVAMLSAENEALKEELEKLKVAAEVKEGAK